MNPSCVMGCTRVGVFGDSLHGRREAGKLAKRLLGKRKLVFFFLSRSIFLKAFIIIVFSQSFMFYEYSFTSNVFVCITNRRWGHLSEHLVFILFFTIRSFLSFLLIGEFFPSFFLFYKPFTLLHFTSPLLNFALDIYYIINYSPIKFSFRCLNFFKISSHQSSQLVGR